MIAFPDTTQRQAVSPRCRDRRLSMLMLRRIMIVQTERFINEGLKHPDEAVVIPTIPVGAGCFPKNWSVYFWQRVLGSV